MFFSNMEKKCLDSEGTVDDQASDFYAEKSQNLLEDVVNWMKEIK